MLRTALLLLPLLGAVVKCTQRTVENTCPPDLLKVEDRQYLQVKGNTCYRFVLYEKKEFRDAEKKCTKYGGTLAMPKTEAASKDLHDMLKQYADIHKSGEAWIGLHDLADEGKFMWVDDTALGKKWNNFAKNNGPLNENAGFLRGLFNRAKRPNRGVEDCVAVKFDDGKWHDFQCRKNLMAKISRSDPHKKYICQYVMDVSKEPTSDIPSKPADEVPTKPADGVPQVPANDVSTKPDDDVPTKPADDVPTKPADDVPTKPDDDVPITPADDVSQVPADDISTKNTCLDKAFSCTKDCGMMGYQRVNGCQVCECNSF